MSKRTYELIENGKIQLCFPANSPKEAAEYIMNEINGNGEWANLVGLDPNQCVLRVTTVIRDYYDLDGCILELKEYGENR